MNNQTAITRVFYCPAPALLVACVLCSTHVAPLPIDHWSWYEIVHIPDRNLVLHCPNCIRRDTRHAYLLLRFCDYGWPEDCVYQFMTLPAPSEYYRIVTQPWFLDTCFCGLTMEQPQAILIPSCHHQGHLICAKRHQQTFTDTQDVTCPRCNRVWIDGHKFWHPFLHFTSSTDNLALYIIHTHLVQYYFPFRLDNLTLFIMSQCAAMYFGRICRIWGKLEEVGVDDWLQFSETNAENVRYVY